MVSDIIGTLAKINKYMISKVHSSLNPKLFIKDTDSMLLFINSLRVTDKYITDIYLNGGCYQFHLFLKTLAPGCEARITPEKNHVVTYFNGKYFDITGEVKGQFEPLNQYEIEMCLKWSFAKTMALQICECPMCEEPIIV